MAGAEDPAAGAGGEGGEGENGPDPAKRVTARIVDQSGRPVANTQLLVDGRSGMSDENGILVFDDVPDTYQAWSISASKTHVLIWQGVTRRDPVFKIGSSATLSVTVEGAVTLPEPLPQGATLQVGLLCEDGNSVYSYLEGAGSYDLAVPWPVPGEKSCQVLALAMDGHTPIGTALHEVTLDESSQLVGVDLALTTPDLRTVTLSAQNLPSGGNLVSAHAGWGPFAFYPRQDGPSAFTLFVPDLDVPVRTWVGADVEGHGAVEEELPREVTSFAMDFARMPTLIEPAAGASVDEDTVFTWSVPGTVTYHTVEMQLGTVHVFLYTNSTSVPLPDFAAADIQIPPESASTWRVMSESSPATIDQRLVAGTHPLPDKRYQRFERLFTYE